MKTCSICGINKDGHHFSVDRKNKDGTSNRCKDCRKQRYIDNRKQEIRNARNWQNENREHTLELARNHYKNNRNKMLEANRVWHKTHKERVRVKNMKKRSEINRLPFAWSDNDEYKANLYFKNRCPICNRQYVMGLKSHFDHWIPISDPYTPGTVPWNMVPLCEQCNLSKHNADAHEWLARRFSDDPVKVKIIEKRIERFFEYTRDSISSGN